MNLDRLLRSRISICLLCCNFFGPICSIPSGARAEDLPPSDLTLHSVIDPIIAGEDHLEGELDTTRPSRPSAAYFLIEDELVVMELEYDESLSTSNLLEIDANSDISSRDNLLEASIFDSPEAFCQEAVMLGSNLSEEVFLSVVREAWSYGSEGDGGTQVGSRLDLFSTGGSSPLINGTDPLMEWSVVAPEVALVGCLAEGTCPPTKDLDVELGEDQAGQPPQPVPNSDCNNVEATGATKAEAIANAIAACNACMAYKASTAADKVCKKYCRDEETCPGICPHTVTKVEPPPASPGEPGKDGASGYACLTPVGRKTWPTEDGYKSKGRAVHGKFKKDGKFKVEAPSRGSGGNATGDEQTVEKLVATCECGPCPAEAAK